VTHTWPDLDAIASTWLIKKYLPGWKNAELHFVPAGKTLKNKPPDQDPNIIHTDTGRGKFDHHQISEKTSAAKRVFQYLSEKKHIPANQRKPLQRLVEIITIIDNFGEVNFPDPTSDVYDLSLHQLIEGLKIKYNSDLETTLTGYDLLEASLNILRKKVLAEKEIKKGLIFNCSQGKALALISSNEESAKLALKSGFQLVVRKDKNREFLKIKAHPNSNIDLTSTYQLLKKIDPKALWFLHQSKKILLNGSAKNPDFVPTKLSLQKIIEVLKKI